MDNQLSGEIPPELGYLPYLRELYLSGNRLTGCIPDLSDVYYSDIMSVGLPYCEMHFSAPHSRLRQRHEICLRLRLSTSNILCAG